MTEKSNLQNLSKVLYVIIHGIPSRKSMGKCTVTDKKFLTDKASDRRNTSRTNLRTSLVIDSLGPYLVLTVWHK